MKIKVEKIIQPLELSEYHEAYAGKRVLVWVNPPRDVKQEREKILTDYGRILRQTLLPDADMPVSKKEKPDSFAFVKRLFSKKEISGLDEINERMFVWLTLLWNQHENEDCRWPVADIRELYEADPAMYQWMVRRTVQMLSEFRADSKKK